MQFEIVSRKIKEPAIGNMIIKMFEYFSSENNLRAEKIKRTKNREELLILLGDLADYIEKGLKKKFSLNFIVFINEQPNYALKYEKNYLMGLKYCDFDIILLKTPFICIPTKFYKSDVPENQEKITKYIDEK